MRGQRLVVSAVVALGCTQARPASPTATTTSSTSPAASASAVPRAAASAVASGAHSDDSTPVGKVELSPRMQAADRLLDGDITRGEQRCATLPVAEREACVDAFLASRSRQRQDAAQKAEHLLSILFKLAEAHCAHDTKLPHDECLAADIDQRLRDLPCNGLEADAEQACREREVLERYGP